MISVSYDRGGKKDKFFRATPYNLDNIYDCVSYDREWKNDNFF
jgi:hypothetical protein